MQYSILITRFYCCASEQLKKKVHDATGVPICRQAIRGWPPACLHDAQIPTTQLSVLGLSGENELILIDLTEEGYMDFEKYVDTPRTVLTIFVVVTIYFFKLFHFTAKKFPAG